MLLPLKTLRLNALLALAFNDPIEDPPRLIFILQVSKSPEGVSLDSPGQMESILQGCSCQQEPMASCFEAEAQAGSVGYLLGYPGLELGPLPHHTFVHQIDDRP